MFSPYLMSQEKQGREKVFGQVCFSKTKTSFTKFDLTTFLSHHLKMQIKKKTPGADFSYPFLRRQLLKLMKMMKHV